jgi:hypothetical protein
MAMMAIFMGSSPQRHVENFKIGINKDRQDEQDEKLKKCFGAESTKDKFLVAPLYHCVKSRFLTVY